MVLTDKQKQIAIDREKRKRISKLRVININTRYDVTGNLKWLARAIDRGKYGTVTDAVIALRVIRPGGATKGETFHFGTGNIANAYHALDMAKKDIT
jgi:hypothetical protein